MPDLTDAYLDELAGNAVIQDQQLAELHDMLDYDVPALHAPAAYMEARNWMRAETVVGDLIAEVRRLRAAVAAVDAIHYQYFGGYVDDGLCPTCDSLTWPCPTHRALHPEPTDAH